MPALLWASKLFSVRKAGRWFAKSYGVQVWSGTRWATCLTSGSQAYLSDMIEAAQQPNGMLVEYDELFSKLALWDIHLRGSDTFPGSNATLSDVPKRSLWLSSPSLSELFRFSEVCRWETAAAGTAGTRP